MIKTMQPSEKSFYLTVRRVLNYLETLLLKCDHASQETMRYEEVFKFE